MRLINTETLQLEKFAEGSVPPYAILSHTWGADAEELTFSQLQDGNIDRSSLGWIKLDGTCRQAKKDRLSHAWIDTCCIDKSNAFELSESINSMYRWYREAAVCYVLLPDVSATDDPASPESTFRKSRWFTRGWTLQELLAPKTLRFYNADWHLIGNKAKMCTLLGEITGVPRSVLVDITDLHQASVAQRMSWAAKRQTKMPEDMAYCLLGIFGVMMPMDYGEGGPEAFLRLQDGVMKVIADDSIFAWGLGAAATSTESPSQDVGVRALASHPSDFAGSGDIVPRQHSKEASSPELDARGRLRICLPLTTVDPERKLALLNCGPVDEPECVVGVPLVRTDTAATDYVRPRGSHASLVQLPCPQASCETIHIANEA